MITLGSTLPKILRVKANRRVSFFIPRTYDSFTRAIVLEPNEHVDLNYNEVLELGSTLDTLLQNMVIQTEVIGQALDASDVSYEPQYPPFFGDNSLPLNDALDILQVAVQSGGGGAPPYYFTTANYSISPTLAGGTIEAKPLIGSIDLTLPTAIGSTGIKFTVKNSGTGYVVNVLTVLGQLIDGQFTRTVPTNQSRTYQSNGANWMLI